MRLRKLFFTFVVIYLPVTVAANDEPVQRRTQLKADYLIYGTEKNFTNFLRLNAVTTYATFRNTFDIFYDYGLTKGASKEWEPSRNLLRTEIKSSYTHNQYDFSLFIEDNQDKISVFSRFYTFAVGGYKNNTRMDVGYGFGHIWGIILISN